MDKIIIIGAGGHAKTCIDIILNDRKYEIFGIVNNERNEPILNFPIVGRDADLENIFNKCKNAFVGIGQIYDNDSRVKIYDSLKSIGYKLPIIISHKAQVSKFASIGEATVIMNYANVGPDVSINKNCIINTNATIEHDVTIGENTHISTGAIINGDVKIGKDCFIGSGAVIKNGVRIKDNTFIKMGSVIKNDVTDG